MRAGRWITGLLLCCLFVGSSWYAVRALSQARREHAAVAALTTTLQELRTGRRRLENRMDRARQAAELLERAGRLGLDPDGWMFSSFNVDTQRELDALLVEDPLLDRLHLEKKRIAKEHDDTQALINASGKAPVRQLLLAQKVEKETGILLHKVEERIRLRSQWLEAQTRYTGAAVVSLLNDLSDSSYGAWFAPESFELERVSSDRYEVRVRGTFLAPQQAESGNAGAAP